MEMTIELQPMDRFLDPDESNYRAYVYRLAERILSDGGSVIIKPAFCLCPGRVKKNTYRFEPVDLTEWDAMIKAFQALSQKWDDACTDALEEWLKRGCKGK